MKKPIRSIACAGALGIAGCAAPPGAWAPHYAPLRYSAMRGPQCFRANEVFGYTPQPDGFVIVHTAEGPFRMRLGPGCPDFSWIMQIGVRPMESSWLCEGHADELITAFETPSSRCAISDIQALAPGAVPA
jgi:hypothetical protein